MESSALISLVQTCRRVAAAPPKCQSMRSRNNNNPKDAKAVMRAIFRIVDVAGGVGAVVVVAISGGVSAMIVVLIYCTLAI